MAPSSLIDKKKKAARLLRMLNSDILMAKLSGEESVKLLNACRRVKQHDPKLLQTMFEDAMKESLRYEQKLVIAFGIGKVSAVAGLQLREMAIKAKVRRAEAAAEEEEEEETL